MTDIPVALADLIRAHPDLEPALIELIQTVAKLALRHGLPFRVLLDGLELVFPRELIH